MSLSKSSRIFAGVGERFARIRSGLRWKIAFFFSLAFLLTLGFCFFIIYLCQSRVLYQTLHTHLTRASDDFAVEYLRGSPLMPEEAVVPLESVPASETDTLRKMYPDFVPLLALGTRQNHRLTFLGTVGGSTAAVSKTGDLIYFQHKSIRMDEFYEDFSEERSYPFIFILIQPDGSVVHSPLPKKVLRLFLAEEKKNPTQESGLTRTRVQLRRHNVIVHKRRFHDGSVLLAGLSCSETERSLHQLLLLFGFTLLAAPLLGWIAGWYAGTQLSRGLRRVTASACRIRESRDYSARVESGDGVREISDLTGSFNAMVENTEKLLAELRSITDNVAHDLRTPLTRLRGKAELAINENADSELASDVAEECSNMLEMINTALELAQTESGADMKRREPLDLNRLVENLADLYSVAAEDAEIDLQYHVPEDPCMINGSKSRLQRLLANLLDNALKYTPPGGRVTISLSKKREEILLRVSDTGHGIAPEDLPHIFDRFYRADSSRSLPGNGLGLSLVRAIAENHGGSVHAESTPGKGTDFIITFSAAGRRG